MAQENQINTLTPADREAFRRVVGYLWDAEWTNHSFESIDDWRLRANHVFRDVYQLARVAFGAKVLDTRVDSETGEKFALVRVRGILAVEQDGRVYTTERDGDAFREFVGIYFGAMTDLALSCLPED